MRIVVAIGGNALLRRGEALEIETQRRNLARAVITIARLAERHQIVVTHGSGPQVGLLALQSEALEDVAPYPLDVLDAETEGLIGYMIERELRGHLPGRQIATLLTQVRIDPNDPAFEAPEKPIGPLYEASEVRELQTSRGWVFRSDGRGYRRVVPSPEPKAILELPTIRLLLDAGVVVICAGGGGIPVTVDAVDVVRGVEAVIDKDLTTALLAVELEADALLLLTDVEAVSSAWPDADAAAIRTASPADLAGFDFESGTMAPKVAAASMFAEATGGFAAIGALDAAAEILDGRGGTQIRSDAILTYYDA